MDYPLTADVYDLIPQVRAKTISGDFDEQLDAAEVLYGQHLRFHFDEQTIQKLLDEEPYYPAEMKMRVKEILLQQRRKYEYLFDKK